MPGAIRGSCPSWSNSSTRIARGSSSTCPLNSFFASPEKKVSVLLRKIRERIGLKSSESIFLYTHGEVLNLSHRLADYAPPSVPGNVAILRVLAATSEIYG